jgi:hypothetical protein
VGSGYRFSTHAIATYHTRSMNLSRNTLSAVWMRRDVIVDSTHFNAVAPVLSERYLTDGILGYPT